MTQTEASEPEREIETKAEIEVIELGAEECRECNPAKTSN